MSESLAMTQSQHLERREQLKRLSLDSSLTEYMDSNKCIEEVLKQLEEGKRNVKREKLAVARLQRDAARSRSEGTMREKLIHELEEERRLRLESEKRLREVTEESELGRAHMVSLQQHFSRMEETVRTLLQNQGILQQPAVDAVDIMTACKDERSEHVQKQKENLEEAQAMEEVNNGSSESDGKEETMLLLERLQVLEAENSALALENESQREQYERCLDEVANQVVQALLTQKDLREECLKLRTRVFDLELQNRALSTLFQQRIRPASDLLLQKLHSRITGLSSSDLLLEPERTRSFLLSRNAESPPHEAQLSGRVGLPVAKCRSQLSLSVPAATYPRSSCSSSELSLSSVCSEYSSGSYTWNEARSCGKLSSLTWEKRVSLGSSAPGNICGLPEEQLSTHKKECHILAGLKRLQKRWPKEPSSLVAKPGYKDCMNSNEGIYSLGIKCGAQGLPKTPRARKSAAFGGRRKTFAYDSDEADDELPRSRGQLCSSDGRDCWLYSKKLTHSVSDSLCSWDEGQSHKLGGSCHVGAVPSKCPPIHNTKEPVEKPAAFTNGHLTGGISHDPPLLHLKLNSKEVSCCLHLSDTDELEDLIEGRTDNPRAQSCPAERLETDPKRLSAVVSSLPTECSHSQSAEDQPQRLSQLLLQKRDNDLQSEECITVIFDAEDGQPIELSSQFMANANCGDLPGSRPQTDRSAEYVRGPPDSQAGGKVRDYTVLESPETAIRLQQDGMTSESVSLRGQSEDVGSEHSQNFVLQQQKLIKPAYSHNHKLHSISPVHSTPTVKANLTKIPSRGKGSPQKLVKGSSTDTNSSGGSPGPGAKEKSPLSPPVKLSRFIKTPGCSNVQSPKGVQMSSKLPPRNDWSKGSSSGATSPLLSRKQLELANCGEPPTRDLHCDGGQTEPRSPSPPPPPGRSTSLLIRPNYDNSPQALKPGAHPPMSSTVRGTHTGSHKYPQSPPPLLGTQHAGPHKGNIAPESDESFNSEVTPQRVVDCISSHPPKASTLCQTPTKGSPKRVPAKLHHSSPPAGHAPDDAESVLKGSKNIPLLPTLHASHKDSPQGVFGGKKSQLAENGHPLLCKASSSLPLYLEGYSPCQVEQSGSPSEYPQTPLSCSGSENKSQNSAERASKTRIPTGLKALVKSPSMLKSGSATPGKQEKEHANTSSKGAASQKAPASCDALQNSPGVDVTMRTSQPEASSGVHCSSMEKEPCSKGLTENNLVCDGDNRFFKRSVSVTTKPHLKPALGMNGAKARSQSFSTHYMEKPCINMSDGVEKVRTQIITNTGERGNSLSRQNSSGVGLQFKPISGSGQNTPQQPYNLLDSNAGMSGTSSHSGIPSKSTSRSGQKVDVPQIVAKSECGMLTPQKEARSLSLTDRFGHKSSRQPMKVASHPQFDSPSSFGQSSDLKAESTSIRVQSPNKSDPAKTGKKLASGSKGQEEPKRLGSPSACTIEERVMMGIVENVQKGQGQEKSQATETKQKSSSTLASWFGFRKTKLPALNSKKTDASKEKGEKKELKLGSVLGGRQMKSEKKKDKKKTETQCRGSQEFNAEISDKLSPGIDQKYHAGPLMGQIQCSASNFGKDQLRMDLLNGTVAKSDSHAVSLSRVSVITQGIPKKNNETTKDMEINSDTTTLTQKSRLQCENDEDAAPEPPTQDPMLGSSCQMRTLDSGIGTFPLPESVTRATSRNPTKLGTCPTGALGDSSGPLEDPALPSPPKSKVPSCCQRSLTHSMSAPSMPVNSSSHTLSQTSSTVASDITNPKILKPGGYKPSPEYCGKAKENRKINTDNSLSTERALRVCLYSGSSSEAETEPDSEGTIKDPGQGQLRNKIKNRKRADDNEEITKKKNAGNRLSIMDYCQQELCVRYGKEKHRGSSTYNFFHKDTNIESEAGDCSTATEQLDDGVADEQKAGITSTRLVSLNEINSNSGAFAQREQRNSSSRAGGDGPGPRRASERLSSCNDRPRGDNLGSLSDSLYDSFSSCASQSSNDV